MSDEVVVDENSVNKIEQDLKSKREAEEKKRKEELAKLIEEARKTGKDEAIEKYEIQAKIKHQEAEIERLRKEREAEKEALEKEKQSQAEQLAELKKQMEELRSKPRGLTRNESPYAKDSNQAPVANFTPEEQIQIARASWAALTGEPEETLDRK
jgi:DNA repair exonuclease SbcCD ATPase subunit